MYNFNTKGHHENIDLILMVSCHNLTPSAAAAAAAANTNIPITLRLRDNSVINLNAEETRRFNQQLDPKHALTSHNINANKHIVKEILELSGIINNNESSDQHTDLNLDNIIDDRLFKMANIAD